MRLCTGVVAMLCALCTGCFTVRHGYEGDLVLTSDSEIPGYRVKKVRSFALHDRQFFWLHGGLPVGEPLNGAALAAREAKGHDGVINLRLRDGEDLLDTAISHGLCVLTIFCGQWSVWVEGDIVDLEAE